MTLPTSILAYEDCRQLFEAAMEDLKGARMKCEDYDAAFHLRSRLHYYRTLHRMENAVTYTEDHPMFGKSEFDKITVKIKNIDNEFFIYLNRNDNPSGEIEKLSNVEDKAD